MRLNNCSHFFREHLNSFIALSGNQSLGYGTSESDLWHNLRWCDPHFTTVETIELSSPVILYPLQDTKYCIFDLLLREEIRKCNSLLGLLVACRYTPSRRTAPPRAEIQLTEVLVYERCNPISDNNLLVNIQRCASIGASLPTSRIGGMKISSALAHFYVLTRWLTPSADDMRPVRVLFVVCVCRIARSSVGSMRIE